MTDKRMIIMQGIPGSGKSTLANQIALDAEEHGRHVRIFSADDFWYTEVGDDPEHYDFDAIRAFEAHRWNQRRVAAALLDGKADLIIIDNTNLFRERCEAYIQLAQMFEWEWSVISVQVPVEVAIARQANRSLDRQVPEEVIRRMHMQLEPIA